MKRFHIKQLILISDKEKASFEADFEKGLNIVIGSNKTGKSSIIKSVFYTLGCDTDMEESWKKLISAYILFFYYGVEKFCIIRQNKRFRIYETDENNSKFVLICNADNYDEYSKYLLNNILDIKAELVSKVGKSVSFIPPVLFRLQYIDQDGGWRKIGESFTNVSYIKDWKKYSIKFIIGYQGEDYYRLKNQIDMIGTKINSLRVKHNHYNEIFESITESFNSVEINLTTVESVEKLKEKADNVINDLSTLGREKISVNESISKIKNEIYEKTLELRILKSSIEHLEKDHDFALLQDEPLKCPVCGMVYINSISQRIELVKDIQSGNELVNAYRSDINNLQNDLDELLQEQNIIMERMNKSIVTLRKIRKDMDIEEIYKSEGRKEVINVSKNERGKLELEITIKEVEKSNYEQDVKKLESRRRTSQIKNDFIAIYKDVLEKVNIDDSYIKLTNFIQKLENTGSERPRIILSYHLGLYLYNLERGENPFNWLVIDTPNQQGQDAKNLKNIDSLISLMLTEKGQVVIGTERETGFENSANKIISLTKYKKCLHTENYEKHRTLLAKLDSMLVSYEI